MKLRHVTAAITAALVLAGPPATGLATAEAAPRPAPQADDPATSSTMSIGTYNIRAGETFATFKEGINAYLPQVDVAGLQEIAGLERTRWLRSSQDWHVFMPPDLGQVPIVWNPQKFDFRTGHEVKLSDATKVEGGTKPATYAAVVHLTQVGSGQPIAVVNAHLLQGAVRLGVMYPGRPLAFALYKHQVARLKQTVLDEQADGNTVYVTGDFNVGFAADRATRTKGLPYRTLSSIGMTAIWEGRKLQPSGTHIDHDCKPGVKECGAYLDQVWSFGPSASAKVLTGIVDSDHYPVLATYDLPLVTPDYTPVQGTIGFAETDATFKEGNLPANAHNPRVCYPLTGDLRHGWARVEVVPGGGTATEGEDFTVDVQSWSDNDLDDNCVDIYTTPDHQTEPDETFTIRLVDPVDTSITIAEATGTIKNDD